MNLPIDGSNGDAPGRNSSLAVSLLVSVVAHLVILTASSESYLIAPLAPTGSVRMTALAAHITPLEKQSTVRNNRHESARTPQRDTKRVLPANHSPEPVQRQQAAEDVLPRMVGEIDSDIDTHDEVGSMVIRIEIDRFGSARSLTVEQSSVSRVVEAQVVSRFYQARYEPGTRDGVPIDSAIRISVNLGGSAEAALNPVPMVGEN